MANHNKGFPICGMKFLLSRLSIELPYFGYAELLRDFLECCTLLPYPSYRKKEIVPDHIEITATPFESSNLYSIEARMVGGLWECNPDLPVPL